MPIDVNFRLHARQTTHTHTHTQAHYHLPKGEAGPNKARLHLRIKRTRRRATAICGWVQETTRPGQWRTIEIAEDIPSPAGKMAFCWTMLIHFLSQVTRHIHTMQVPGPQVAFDGEDAVHTAAHLSALLA